MTEGPGISIAAEVPTHQKAIHSGVGQNRLRPRVKVMYIHRTALILWIQEPGRDSVAHWSDCLSDTELSVMVFIYSFVLLNESTQVLQVDKVVTEYALHTPGLTRLEFGWFGWLVCLNCKKLDGTIIWCNSKVMWPLTKGQCFHMASNPRIRKHRPETITFSIIPVHITGKQQPREFRDIV